LIAGYYGRCKAQPEHGRLRGRILCNSKCATAASFDRRLFVLYQKLLLASLIRITTNPVIDSKTKSTDEQAFITRVQSFAAATVHSSACDWSMGQSPSQALYQKAAEIGLTGIEVPTQLGGQGFSFKVKADACALLAGADFGFAMSIVNTHNVALRLCASASPEIRDKYLPDLLAGNLSACTALTEPSTGSDFAAIKTRATQTNNGWVVDGEKSWIVNARHAGLAIVFAQCADEGDSGGIAAFLIDLTLPGVQCYPIDTAFSQTSIGTGGIKLERVEVNSNHLLIAPGMAFKSILNEINGARVYVAAMANAMMSAALQELRAYGEHRYSFGKPLIEHESWLRTVTQAEAPLHESEALTAIACEQVNRGKDAQLAAIDAKISAVENCQQQLPLLLHAMGAEGLRPEYCFTRHLAAAQMASLTDGATSLLRERAIRLRRKKS